MTLPIATPITTPETIATSNFHQTTPSGNERTPRVRAAEAPIASTEAMIRPRNSAAWISCSEFALTKNVPTIEARMPTPAMAIGRTTRPSTFAWPAYMKAPRVIAAMIEPT